jgi:hypothetical protein
MLVSIRLRVPCTGLLIPRVDIFFTAGEVLLVSVPPDCVALLAGFGAYFLFARIPAVTVDPLLPPHPTSITLHSK